jgi:hypothetical protein
MLLPLRRDREQLLDAAERRANGDGKSLSKSSTVVFSYHVRIWQGLGTGCHCGWCTSSHSSEAGGIREPRAGGAFFPMDGKQTVELWVLGDADNVKQQLNADAGADFSSGTGLVSRVTPVQTAMRNCTRDEGRSFEVGNQVLISNHRKPLWSKAMVVNVVEKSEQDFGRYDWERRAQANRCRSVEGGLDDVKSGG